MPPPGTNVQTSTLLPNEAGPQTRRDVLSEGEGCVKWRPEAPASLENFGLLFMRLLRPFGKGWCPVGAAERHPARNAGLSRQSGWCSPVMEGSKCPTRHRHDSAKKRRGTPGRKCRLRVGMHRPNVSE